MMRSNYSQPLWSPPTTVAQVSQPISIPENRCGLRKFPETPLAWPKANLPTNPAPTLETLLHWCALFPLTPALSLREKGPRTSASTRSSRSVGRETEQRLSLSLRERAGVRGKEMFASGWYPTVQGSTRGASRSGNSLPPDGKRAGRGARSSSYGRVWKPATQQTWKSALRRGAWIGPSRKCSAFGLGPRQAIRTWDARFPRAGSPRSS